MLQLGIGRQRRVQRLPALPGGRLGPRCRGAAGQLALPSTVVYADEDTVTSRVEHVDPRLKPAYSPEFLLSSSYMGRPLAVGSEIVPRLGA